MKIVVKRQHIEEAQRKDSHHCMIVDALKDHLGVQYILVDVQSIRYSDPRTKERYIHMTPPVAQQMILKWDRGVHAQPFAFTLDPPVKIVPIRPKYRGKLSTRAKAQKKYELMTRKNRMLPRLVKKGKVKVTRFREFGVRQLTKQ